MIIGCAMVKSAKQLNSRDLGDTRSAAADQTCLPLMMLPLLPAVDV
jgi:hypothetical protein